MWRSKYQHSKYRQKYFIMWSIQAHWYIYVTNKECNFTITRSIVLLSVGQTMTKLYAMINSGCKYKCCLYEHHFPLVTILHLVMGRQWQQGFYLVFTGIEWCKLPLGQLPYIGKEVVEDLESEDCHSSPMRDNNDRYVWGFGDKFECRLRFWWIRFQLMIGIPLSG